VTVADILKSVRFLVDQKGEPTAIVLEMDAWEAFLSMLEDVEDAELIRERTRSWRSKEGWTRWQDFEAELEANGLSTIVSTS
jgi:hypothetical protein